MKKLDEKYNLAAKLIKKSAHTTLFTGAGISAESGIPPFRGDNGIWNRYNPKTLEINYFLKHPRESWKVIKEIFYTFFEQAKPNKAHQVIARMEKKGYVKAVITQNIDNLHKIAGSNVVYEFHGTTGSLTCIECSIKYNIKDVDLGKPVPLCHECKGILKPDFTFFGEAIPEPANTMSFDEAQKADVFIIIGTSGEVVPASIIPTLAKKNGAKIIEINLRPSEYTESITDIFLQGKATEVMSNLESLIF